MSRATARRRAWPGWPGAVGLLALAAVVLAPSATPTGAVTGAGGTWAPTGRLATAVSFQTATLLASGQVLVAGGTSAAAPPPPRRSTIHARAAGARPGP